MTVINRRQLVTVTNQGQLESPQVEREQSEEIVSSPESQFPIRASWGPKTGHCKTAGKWHKCYPPLKQNEGTSLVAQWLRIHLPMQGTRVRALVREDPTCRGATKPVSHNYWACTLEPACHNYWALVLRAGAPQQEKPPQWEARALQWRAAPLAATRESPRSSEDPVQPKINK